MSVTPIIDRRLHVQPADVHSVLARHMLADGYEIVMDLAKSKGSWVFDSRRGRAVLDFFTNFASCPIGYNHPRLDNLEFRDRIANAAVNNPANSEIYTTYMARFSAPSSGTTMPKPSWRSGRTTSPRSSWSPSRVREATTTSAPSSSRPSGSSATRTRCC